MGKRGEERKAGGQGGGLQAAHLAKAQRGDRATRLAIQGDGTAFCLGLNEPQQRNQNEHRRQRDSGAAMGEEV